MSQLFAFLLVLGCAFLVSGTGSLIIKKLKPVGTPRNKRTAAIVGNGMARNFQTLAIPMVITAGALIVVGGLRLALTSH